MKISIECGAWDNVVDVDLANSIKTMIACAEKENHFYSFMCPACAKACATDFNENN